jgi:hypothetical protein
VPGCVAVRLWMLQELVEVEHGRRGELESVIKRMETSNRRFLAAQRVMIGIRMGVPGAQVFTRFGAATVVKLHYTNSMVEVGT